MLKSCYRKNELEAGCDEAGRGCLAGPVFAAAVILPPHFRLPELNDSKKLSEKMRKELRKKIELLTSAWAVSSVSHEKIEKINILNASILAMHKALDKLPLTPSFLLIDGNRFIRYHNIPHHCIVKGDGQYLSIAAASVLAKTHRDEYMLNLHRLYPCYGWNKNKGYATKEHKTALKKYGISKYHRKTFYLYSQQMKLEL